MLANCPVDSGNMVAHITLEDFGDYYKINISGPQLDKHKNFHDYAKDVIIQQLNHGDNSVVYGCKLIRAFPTTMQAIELGDDAQNQLTQLSVQLSYTVWEPS